MISLVSTSTSFGTSNVEDNISKFINAKLSTRFINNPSELSRIANRISSQSLPRPSYMDTYKLTASQALTQIRSGKLKIEDYALSLLSRINQRDGVIKAWAYIDPEYVLAQAKRLDLVPFDERGPIHGMPIAVKDVIYTKGDLLPIFLCKLLLLSHQDTPNKPSWFLVWHSGALMHKSTASFPETNIIYRYAYKAQLPDLCR